MEIHYQPPRFEMGIGVYEHELIIIVTIKSSMLKWMFCAQWLVHSKSMDSTACAFYFCAIIHRAFVIFLVKMHDKNCTWIKLNAHNNVFSLFSIYKFPTCYIHFSRYIIRNTAIASLAAMMHCTVKCVHLLLLLLRIKFISLSWSAL